MNIVAQTEEYQDRYEPGAFAGAALAAGGIRNSTIIFHGIVGCLAEAVYLMNDQHAAGSHTPVIGTGLQESHCIQGGVPRLKDAVRDVLNSGRTKPELLWILTGDAPSIAGDDVKSAALELANELGIRIIALDTPGFIGGFVKGAEAVYCSILDNLAAGDGGEKEGVNVVGPYLTGSRNWPFDIPEIVRLLKAADVKVNAVLTHRNSVEELARLSNARANLMLTSEEMPDFEAASARAGIETFGQELPLPLGMANTEDWYLSVAQRFGDVEKAKVQLTEDIKPVSRVIKGNLNAYWGLSKLNGKRAAILGYASFAASMARFLYYDMNVLPCVIGLLGETKRALSNAEALLKPLEEYVEFEVLENPTYYLYGEKLKEAKVDFSVGMPQDRNLSEGLGVPQASLGGFYVFNQFSFLDLPYMGVRGVPYLLTELVNLAERTFREDRMWREYAYRPRDAHQLSSEPVARDGDSRNKKGLRHEQ